MSLPKDYGDDDGGDNQGENSGTMVESNCCSSNTVVLNLEL